MANTKLFKNGNSQAVRIPAELAYSTWDVDLVIERQGDELRIRPAQRRMGDVLGKLAKFSPDFMAQGRGENSEGERETKSHDPILRPPSATGNSDQTSRNDRILRLRDGCLSLRNALASIWRIRSRVTLNCWPTSSSV